MLSRDTFGGLLAATMVVGAAAETVTAQDTGRFEVFQTGFELPSTLLSPPGEPDRILIARLNGVVSVIDHGVLLSTPFLNIQSRVNTDHGLIGLAFPADYATSRRFYVNYTPRGEFGPRIARYTTSADPNVANTTEEVLLMTGGGTGDHAGGWMDFGPDGMLYIARGIAGAEFQPNPAQNPLLIQGKILRIDVSSSTGYTSPPDNPFMSLPGLDEIGAMGVRNPWRDSFDRLTGDLYLADVGGNMMEEIDYVPAGTLPGRNFGWSCMEGTNCLNPTCCADPGFTAPVYAYAHTVGHSVIGGYVYRGSAIPRWRGRYLWLDYISDRLWSMRVVGGIATDVQEHTAGLNAGLPVRGLSGGVAFGQDAEGELYVLEYGGRILKIASRSAPADWDFDGSVRITDFLAFLSDYAQGRADVTGDQRTDMEDFIEFLRLYAQG
jgi:glucose/arabinose dehydrogenase